MWRAVTLALLLAACGDGTGSATPDARPTRTDAAPIDAGASCQDLRDEWTAVVNAAGTACDVSSDCTVIGADFCDSGQGIDPKCGYVVAGAALDEARARALEQAWNERRCDLGGTADCNPITPGCIDNVCRVVELEGCFATNRRSGSIVVSETDEPAAHIDIAFEILQPPSTVVFDDRNGAGEGCVVFAAPRAEANEGAVTISGTQSGAVMCAFDEALGTYECDDPPDGNFLEDGDSVLVHKDAGDEIDELAVTLTAQGAGVALDDASTRLDALPTDGAAAAFSCAGTGGTCGSGLATLVFGEAIDEAETRAQWRCTAFSTANEMSADAMTAILATGPTALRVRYARGNFALASNADGTNHIAVFVGHELAGTTPVP